ncbi:sulfocyanin-like copper-binding protein [Sinomonas sp. JGH33]|uniref:Sulfocyanin-like copper-binding protein n=1 Tax=Sinomonas terricola TaxID=3110330 RepID=A0ABU5TCE9_9MICC|nr:sulfocyanin-like copper-binding protein [Sinomonas sp. JGH33]MEA5457121.1 sulfocyanin-like copper-binding protein [Sinomonas sp. JGH33]
MRRSGLVTILVAAGAALLLTAASLLGLALLGAPTGFQTVGPPACSAPSLPGTLIRVSETDLGVSVMGSPMMRGAMRLSADRTSVPRGQVSIAVTNLGYVPHELLVLPLPGGQTPGTRISGPDGRIDEAGLLGEASGSCAGGAGEGIAPGAVSWVTLNLPAGRYELVCNYPGHYAAGMYGELTVS